MADGWAPANALEQELSGAVQQGDQSRYFDLLLGAQLLLPLPLDASGQPANGWPIWQYEGRTYVLVFTSAVAMAACLGTDSAPHRTCTLAEVAGDWPDESWWLAVDFGLPIAGYLPAPYLQRMLAERAEHAGVTGVPDDGTGSADGLAPSFYAANELEDALVNAVRAGDQSAFLSALLPSSVLIPAVVGAPRHIAVGEPGFPWPREERDGRYEVPVFTSYERLGARLGEVEATEVPLAVILLSWPDASWSLVVNPDTEIAAALDGHRVAELAQWSVDSGLVERLRHQYSGADETVAVEPAGEPAATVAALDEGAHAVDPGPLVADEATRRLTADELDAGRSGAGAPAGGIAMPSGAAVPGNTAPGEPAPGEPAPGESAPGDTTSDDPAPGEPAPGDTAPGHLSEDDRATDQRATLDEYGAGQHAAGPDDAGAAPDEAGASQDETGQDETGQEETGQEDAGTDSAGAKTDHDPAADPTGDDGTGDEGAGGGDTAGGRDAPEPGDDERDPAAQVLTASSDDEAGAPADLPAPNQAPAGSAEGRDAAAASTGFHAAEPAGSVGLHAAEPAGRGGPELPAELSDRGGPELPAEPADRGRSELPAEPDTAVMQPLPPPGEEAEVDGGPSNLADFLVGQPAHASAGIPPVAGPAPDQQAEAEAQAAESAPDVGAASVPYSIPAAPMAPPEPFGLPPTASLDQPPPPFEPQPPPFDPTPPPFAPAGPPFAPAPPHPESTPYQQLQAAETAVPPGSEATQAIDPAATPPLAPPEQTSEQAPESMTPGPAEGASQPLDLANYPILLYKVLQPAHVAFYLERQFDRASGYVYRAEDLGPHGSPERLYRALGLLYEGSPFSADDEAAYVLRWVAYHPRLTPVTRIGLAAGDGSVHEYRIGNTHLPHSAELCRLGRQGDFAVVGVYDADRQQWHRLL